MAQGHISLSLGPSHDLALYDMPPHSQVCDLDALLIETPPAFFGGKTIKALKASPTRSRIWFTWLQAVTEPPKSLGPPTVVLV